MPDTSAHLRPATAHDLPLIYRGEVRYMRDTEPESLVGWTSAVDRNLELWINQLGRTHVLELDGEPAGYLMWMPHNEAALLITINVSPERRKQGLGRVLLDAFVAEAKAACFTRLELGVHRDNPARSLYESAGFTHVSDDGDYLLFERAA